jgi:hypothetical protein
MISLTSSKLDKNSKKNTINMLQEKQSASLVKKSPINRGQINNKNNNQNKLTNFIIYSDETVREETNLNEYSTVLENDPAKSKFITIPKYYKF